MWGWAGAGLVAVLLLGAGLRLSQLWVRREREAALLQARVTDALLVDPLLRPFPVTVIVQPAFWPWSRLTAVLAGEVPDDDIHGRLHASLQRHLRAGHCRYEDRVVVHPPQLAHAA
jgi:hypothetical protein